MAGSLSRALDGSVLRARTEIKYCSVCYGKTMLFMQLDDNTDISGTAYCPSCKTEFIVNRLSITIVRG